MIAQTFNDIYTEELAKEAIINDEYFGFKEDYLILHCLMKKYAPKTIFEMGTNMGFGTLILKNSCPEATVYTLDLPTELAHISLQHPISEGKGDKVGSRCTLPFTQLRGDSMTFDFSLYPCEAYYIDGEHDYDHPYRESSEILKLSPKLIVWHDSDIKSVYDAIVMAFKDNDNYNLYRVTDTRIAYALKK